MIDQIAAVVLVVGLLISRECEFLLAIFLVKDLKIINYPFYDDIMNYFIFFLNFIWLIYFYGLFMNDRSNCCCSISSRCEFITTITISRECELLTKNY